MKTTVISSFAEDRLIRENGVEVRLGGPALFIKRFLEREGFSFNLVTGTKGVVEIDMRGNAEVGRIKDVAVAKEVPSKTEGLVLYSTILDEFPLKAIGSMNCVDVQGYVRDKDSFGKKKVFDSEELLRFDVVKGTRKEISFIPEKLLRKDCVVVRTDGSNGFEISFNGEKRMFSVEKVECPETIGAGDTFFAAFCTKYFKTKDIDLSAEYAAEKAKAFLEEKNVGGLIK